MANLPAHVLRAQRFVAAHLEEALDLDRISAGTGVSKYHLHHDFTAHLGVSLWRYVRLLRLERAANQLAYRQHSVLEIALAAQFESAEAFARAFKREVGQAPSQFRASPDWPAIHRATLALRQARPLLCDHGRFDVSIVNAPATRLVGMTHLGDPRTLGETLRRFIAWRRSAKLPPSRWDTYNLLHTPKNMEPTSAFRLDVATVAPARAQPAAGLWERVLPAARCAVLVVVGDDEQLEPAFNFLYGPWLRENEAIPLEHPPLLRRVRFFPDVSAANAVTEIRLLLAS